MEEGRGGNVTDLSKGTNIVSSTNNFPTISDTGNVSDAYKPVGIGNVIVVNYIFSDFKNPNPAYTSKIIPDPNDIVADALRKISVQQSQAGKISGEEAWDKRKQVVTTT
jgi:hypothetical protein